MLLDLTSSSPPEDFRDFWFDDACRLGHFPSRHVFVSGASNNDEDDNGNRNNTSNTNYSNKDDGSDGRPTSEACMAEGAGLCHGYAGGWLADDGFDQHGRRLLGTRVWLHLHFVGGWGKQGTLHVPGNGWFHHIVPKSGEEACFTARPYSFFVSLNHTISSLQGKSMEKTVNLLVETFLGEQELCLRVYSHDHSLSSTHCSTLVGSPQFPGPARFLILLQKHLSKRIS
jgi:hypothetical protein